MWCFLIASGTLLERFTLNWCNFWGFLFHNSVQGPMYIQWSCVCSEPYSKWELRIPPEEVPIPIDSNSGLFIMWTNWYTGASKLCISKKFTSNCVMIILFFLQHEIPRNQKFYAIEDVCMKYTMSWQGPVVWLFDAHKCWQQKKKKKTQDLSASQIKWLIYKRKQIHSSRKSPQKIKSTEIWAVISSSFLDSSFWYLCCRSCCSTVVSLLLPVHHPCMHSCNASKKASKQEGPLHPQFWFAQSADWWWSEEFASVERMDLCNKKITRFLVFAIMMAT